MNSRPLKDLDPLWTDEGLMFSCPACDDGHAIMPQFWGEPIYPSRAYWRLTSGLKGGGFENVTVEPSINCTTGGACKFHGWVRNGEVIW